jgi:hypothetical protein
VDLLRVAVAHLVVQVLHGLRASRDVGHVEEGEGDAYGRAAYPLVEVAGEERHLVGVELLSHPQLVERVLQRRVLRAATCQGVEPVVRLLV